MLLRKRLSASLAAPAVLRPAGDTTAAEGGGVMTAPAAISGDLYNQLVQ